MAIVAVNGGGNTPNGNAADGTSNTRTPRLDDVTDGTSNTLMLGEKLVRSHLVPMAGNGNDDGRGSAGNAEGYAGSHLLYQDVVVPLGEADVEALVLPSAPADSNAYVLTSVAHAATDTRGAPTHVDGFRFDLRGHHEASLDDVVLVWGSVPGAHDPGDPTAPSDPSTSPTNQGWGHWEINLPPAQPGQPYTFGQPVTFTATIHPGYAGPVFVTSGDVDGAPNNLKRLAFAAIDYDSGASEGVTDGTSNTLLFAEKYARVGAWAPTDYCFETPSITGNAQPDGLSNTVAFGEGASLAAYWPFFVPAVQKIRDDARINPADTSGYHLSALHDGIDPIWIDMGVPVMSAPDGRRYDTQGHQTSGGVFVASGDVDGTLKQLGLALHNHSDFGDADDGALADLSSQEPTGNLHEYVLTSIDHAATDTSSDEVVILRTDYYSWGITHTAHLLDGGEDGTSNGRLPRLLDVTDGTSNTLMFDDDLMGWNFTNNTNNPVADGDTDRDSFIFIFGDGSVRHMSDGGLQGDSFVFDGSSQTSSEGAGDGGTRSLPNIGSGEGSFLGTFESHEYKPLFAFTTFDLDV